MGKLKKVVLMVLTLCVMFSQCVSVQAASSVDSTTESSSALKSSATYTISLNKSVYTMKKGAKVTLKADLNKAAEKKGVTWSSSKKSVATVSSSGKVTAKKKGTTTITATVKGTKIKATCKITVGTPVSKITLNKTKKTLTAGKTFTLKATVTPKKATNTKVTYKSSNKKVATVSSKGVIKAVAAGTAKITVKAKDGSGVKAVCTVTVKNAADSNSTDTGANQNTGSDTSANTGSTGGAGGAGAGTAAVVVAATNVSTQEELNAALADETASQIVYASDASDTITIPAGDFQAKTLEINAPNASVVNNGSFARVIITAIAPNTYTENAYNAIQYDAPSGHIIVGASGVADIMLADTPGQQIQLDNNGSINTVVVSAQASLTIGGTNTVPVTIGANAGNANIVTSVTLNITASATWNMAILPGAENTQATVATVECVPTVSGLGRIPVVISDRNEQINIAAVMDVSLNIDQTVSVSGRIQQYTVDSSAAAAASDAEVYIIPRDASNSDMVTNYDAHMAGLTANTVASENGSFSIPQVQIGNYWLVVKKAGFNTVVKELMILSTDSADYSTGTITMLSDELAAGTALQVGGTIQDALTGSSVNVAGIQVKLRSGSENITGAVYASTLTNEDGTYSFSNIPYGVYTLEVIDLRQDLTETDVRYNDAYTDIVVRFENSSSYNFPLDRQIITITGQGQVQFTLTWGTEESGASRDIDSHLTGPTATGNGRFHVYFSNRSYEVNGETFADLDVDDVSWEGPEHVTIYRQTDGIYSYYIYNFSDSSDYTMLARSGIRVRITIGTSSYVYSCPNQEGNLWYVCDYDSVNHTIIPKNVVSTFTEGSSAIGTTPESRCYSKAEAVRDTLSTFVQNDAAVALTARVAELEAGIATATTTEEYDTIYDELCDIYNDLNYGYGIYYDSSSDYEGISDWWSTSSLAYDDNGNVIGGIYYIERYESVTTQDVMEHLSFVTNSDTSTCTLTLLNADATYQALVQVTNPTTGLVRNVYVRILEY